jgi:hypothetical protein
MPAPEELAAENARVQRILDAGARERLSALPGVVHVTVGLKETGGAPTSEFAVKVYVGEKRPAADLPADQVVPARVEDVPTDVCRVPTASPYTTVVGGMPITNGYTILTSPGHTRMEGGTLGFVARRNDKDHTPVMLGCAHTMGKYGAKKGDLIFQPQPGPDDQIHDSDTFPRKPRTSSNSVGTIVDIKETSTVDCAIAEVDTCHSSCCNCGTEFDHVVKGLNVNGSDALTGVTAAVPNMLVFKVGISTGRTAGRIVTPSLTVMVNQDDGTQKAFQQQMQIVSVDLGKRFGDHGDSGSLIVDDQGRAVGLLMGGEPQPPGQDVSLAPTFANQIGLVMTELGITLPAKTKAVTTVAGFRSEQATTSLPWPLAPLAERLDRSAGGRWLRGLVERHRREVVELVNHRRRVTVAWHRGQGPAWFAAFARSARRPDYRLPGEIDGITRERALNALHEVLVAEGSPELRADLVAHRDFLLTTLIACSTVDELFTLVERTPVRLGSLG